jgi:hypothetical protein
MEKYFRIIIVKYNDMKKILYLGLMLFTLMACESKDGEIWGTAEAGDTVQGITVKLYTMDSGIYATTETDAKGEFAFSGLPAGNYYIGATITINGDVYDTGNTPQAIYVSDEIRKEVALSLSMK